MLRGNSFGQENGYVRFLIVYSNNNKKFRLYMIQIKK